MFCVASIVGMRIGRTGKFGHDSYIAEKELFETVVS